jgi:hypothetical protein
VVKSPEPIFDMYEKESELGHYYVDKAEVSEEDIERAKRER